MPWSIAVLGVLFSLLLLRAGHTLDPAYVLFSLSPITGGLLAYGIVRKGGW